MQRSSSQSGFSLVELLVSITIFSIVVAMATSTLLVLLDANSKAQNEQAILNDLTIAIDSMTREIRTGYNYYCNSGRRTVEATADVRNCAAGADYVSIVEAGDSLTQGSGSQRIGYYYDSTAEAIMRRVGDGDGDANTNEDEDWVAITSPNVRITNVEFVVVDTDAFPSNLTQPSVSVFIEGEAGTLAEVDSTFVIQTSITQRPLDI